MIIIAKLTEYYKWHSQTLFWNVISQLDNYDSLIGSFIMTKFNLWNMKWYCTLANDHNIDFNFTLFMIYYSSGKLNPFSILSLVFKNVSLLILWLLRNFMQCEIKTITIGIFEKPWIFFTPWYLTLMYKFNF